MAAPVDGPQNPGGNRGCLSVQVARVRNFLAGGEEGRMLEYFVAVGVFIDTLSSGMVIPILPSFALRFHSSQALTTLLLALRGTTAIVFAFPAGFIVTYFGHRNVLLLSLIGTIVASLLLAFPLYFPFLGIALFLQGFCSEMAWTTGLSLGAFIYGGKKGKGEKKGEEKGEGSLEEPLLGDSQNGGKKESGEGGGGEGENGLVGAVGVLFGMASLGYLLGPFLGALLYQYTSTWMPFSIVAILTLLTTIVLLILTTGENIFSPKSVSVEKNKINVENGGDLSITETEMETETEEKSESESLIEAFLEAGKNFTILTMLSVSVITLVQFGAIEVILPFFLTTTCSKNTAEVGVVFGVVSVAYGIATIQAEKFVDRFGSTSCILLGLICQTITAPVLFLGHSTCSLPLQCLLMGIAGVSLAFGSTPLFPVMVNVFGELGFKNYTVVVALYNCSFTLGGALGPLLAAGLISYLPASILIGLLSVIMVFCAPLVWWARPSRPAITQLC